MGDWSVKAHCYLALAGSFLTWGEVGGKKSLMWFKKKNEIIAQQFSFSLLWKLPISFPEADVLCRLYSLKSRHNPKISNQGNIYLCNCKTLLAVILIMLRCMKGGWQQKAYSLSVTPTITVAGSSDELWVSFRWHDSGPYSVSCCKAYSVAQTELQRCVGVDDVTSPLQTQCIWRRARSSSEHVYVKFHKLSITFGHFLHHTVPQWVAQRVWFGRFGRLM